MGKKSEINFAEWGIKELGIDFLEKYWDWEKNTVNPYDIPFCMNKPKIWIKCLETDYHGSYDIQCSNFVNGQRCGYCHKQRIHPKDSFAQHIIDIYGEDALELYWDYENNIVNPWEISKSGHKKVWIKCQEKIYHGSYLVECYLFYNYKNCCPYCNHKKVHAKDSFAQWGIDNICEDFLEKYWDYIKNTVNPWGISPRSNNMVHIFCQEKDYHGSYQIRCNHFCDGNRCGYCTGRKVNKKDSIAQWGTDNLGEDFLNKAWNWDKNKISPWNLYYGTHDKVWLNCLNHNSHGSYKISCENLIKGQGCSKCKESFGEKKIRKILLDNNAIFISQYKTEECKNKLPLPFDFAIFKDEKNIKLKCLIEFDGEHHYKPARYSKNKEKMIRKLEDVQLRDKIKNEYCEKNNIKLIRIPYWEFDNIQEILIMNKII